MAQLCLHVNTSEDGRRRRCPCDEIKIFRCIFPHQWSARNRWTAEIFRLLTVNSPQSYTHTRTGYVTKTKTERWAMILRRACEIIKAVHFQGSRMQREQRKITHDKNLFLNRRYLPGTFATRLQKLRSDLFLKMLYGISTKFSSFEIPYRVSSVILVIIIRNVRRISCIFVRVLIQIESAKRWNHRKFSRHATQTLSVDRKRSLGSGDWLKV